MESPDLYLLMFGSVPVLIIIGCLIAAFTKK